MFACLFVYKWKQIEEIKMGFTTRRLAFSTSRARVTSAVFPNRTVMLQFANYHLSETLASDLQPVCPDHLWMAPTKSPPRASLLASSTLMSVQPSAMPGMSGNSQGSELEGSADKVERTDWNRASQSCQRQGDSQGKRCPPT